MLRRAFRIFKLRGLSYLWHVAREYALPRVVAGLVFQSRISGFCRRVVSGFAKYALPTRGVPRQAADPRSFLSARDWLPEEIWEAALSFHREDPDEPLVLGEIDNDGRVKTADWIHGHLPHTDEVDAETFEPRRRHRLELVLSFKRDDGVILIRKDFLGDEQAFRHEWRSLAALSGTLGSPEIYRAEERLHLYRSFVPGPTVRQVLVDAGAHILSTETDTDQEFADLGNIARIEAVWARGRECFHALPKNFFDQLERHVNAMHHRGVTGFSLTFGNIVLHPQNGPWFIDFDRAERHRPPPKGVLFAVRRDRDRELFNRIYGRDILTEKTARQLAKKLSTPYSPFDLGRGVATRGFWSVDSGTGRWDVLNRQALSGLIEDRRILDLGSYNGLMPLLMLRAGAREVVAFERDPVLVEQGQDLRRLFEWRYMKSYEGFDLRCADMRAILEDDLGVFDLVTTFCSLYYLEEDEMRRVVRRAAEVAPILVVQAKTDTRWDAADGKATKSSLEFLTALIKDNGFPSCEIVAPVHYSRPLLIGRRAATVRA